jgi:hypothetical protein
MKRFLNGVALAIAAFAIALTLPSLLPPMQALPAQILLSQNINFKPPDVTAPNSRVAGTHRSGGCVKDVSIIPLIPKSNIGLTVAEMPTFLADISSAATQEIEFALQTYDGKNNEVYQTTFKVDKPGIVEINIPKKGDGQTSLQLNQPYQWSLSVPCNQDYSEDYLVTGFVQRIEPQPTLKETLANPDRMALAIAYAKNGIWYDTISTLAQMRRQAPDDPMLKAEWTQLLNSQKLESIAYKPLVQSF